MFLFEFCFEFGLLSEFRLTCVVFLGAKCVVLSPNLMLTLLLLVLVLCYKMSFPVNLNLWQLILIVIVAVIAYIINNLIQLGALVQIRRALKPDGLFMAAALGGRALIELRQALLAAEGELDGGASPRVTPFGDVREYGALLQRVGFAMPVADAETLEVIYSSPRELMREVRALGGGNVLMARSKTPLSRRTLERAEEIYRELHGTPDGKVTATFEFVFMSGWAPDASQQKPLKPGSAVQRLADALNTDEQPAGDRASFPAVSPKPKPI